MAVEETPRKVAWWSVIGGLALGFVLSILITPAAMFGGAFATQFLKGAAAPAAGLLSALLSIAVYYGLYRLLGKRNDVALGVLISGFLVMLLSGGCGMLLSQLITGNVSMH